MNIGAVPNLYTYQQIADVFQVCSKVIYRWFKGRRKFRLGNTVRIPEEEVEKLFQERLAARADAGLVQRWTQVKRTRRPGVRASIAASKTP
jgi:predicted DNA-binding transcriptional regulator AlpA